MTPGARMTPRSLAIVVVAAIIVIAGLVAACAKRARRSIAQDVTQLLSEALEPSEPRSILELRGLGRDLWRDVDAATHVDRERASWD